MNNKNPSELQIARLKFEAGIKTAKLLVLTLHKFYIGIAMVAIIIAMIFGNMNPWVALVITLFGCLFFTWQLPLRKMWRANLAGIYQNESLWQLADDLIFEDCGQTLPDVLEGKKPKEIEQTTKLALVQAQLVYIRNGDCQNALKIAEYVQELNKAESDAISYEDVTAASLLVAVGKYDDAIFDLKATLRYLDNENRSNSPATATTLILLGHAYSEIHKFDEAETYFNRVKDLIDQPDKDLSTNHMDRVVRAMEVKDEALKAIYFTYLGRFLVEKRDVKAELPLKAARDIMGDESLQKTNQLLLPEIFYGLSLLELLRHDYSKAEEYASQSLQGYETKTRYFGTEYLKTKAAHAFAKFKQTANPDLATDIEESLDKLQKQVEPNHPAIATCLVQVSECYKAAGAMNKARDALIKAGDIRRQLFSKDDPLVVEIERLANSLSIV